MSWVTVIWSAGMGVCLILALMHFLIWFRDRKSWSSFCFPVIALGIVCMGFCELSLMLTDSPDEFLRLVRIGHVLFGVTVAASLLFVHLDFGTGRSWLLLLALGLRTAAVTANLVTDGSLHFISIQSLEKIRFLGESISIVNEATENPWVRLGQLAALVQIAYVIDASTRLWRRGGGLNRHRALSIGGSTVLLFLVGFVLVGSISAGALRAPILVSFPFFGMVLAIGYDMSSNLIRTAQLAKELEANERRLALAGAAGRIAFWEWDLKNDRIWFSKDGWAVFGIEPASEVNFERFMVHVHEDDRSRLEETVRESVEKTGAYSAEFRLVATEGGRPRWLSATGKVEKNNRGEPVLFRGFSIDVSRRKDAESQAAQQRRELTHLSRVGTLGALSGALAHELNQPLAAILSNAQVGRRRLGAEPPDLAEMDEILHDIVDDTKRAGNIVHGMRAMFAKDAPVDLQAVDLNGVVADSLKLLHSEIIARKTRIEFTPLPTLPPITASFIELQQVFINLIVNSLDAISGQSAGVSALPPCIRIIVSDTPDGIMFEVADNGPGIPLENLEHLFEPFFSTKSPGKGLGLGLSISRGIVERYGGKLIAVPPEDGCGAVFRIAFPPPSADAKVAACDHGVDADTPH